MKPVFMTKNEVSKSEIHKAEVEFFLLSSAEDHHKARQWTDAEWPDSRDESDPNVAKLL